VTALALPERSGANVLRRLAGGHPGQAAALRAWQSSTGAPPGTVPTSVLLLLAEHHAAALTVVDTVVSDLTAQGDPLGLAFYLGLRSELSFRTGEWVAASSSARQALRLAEEQGSLTLVAFAAAGLARVAAGRGAEQECRAFVGLAHATVPVAGSDLTVPAVEALTLLLLGSGRPGEAASVGSEPGGPRSLWLGTDVVEALVRTGEREAAERTLGDVADDAALAGQAWARAAVRRCHGLLARDHVAEDHFREALDLHRSASTPFDAARTELCLGEWLRRNRRPRDAAGELRRALATFGRLGAASWADRTHAELRACGEHCGDDRRGSGGYGVLGAGLTPQEERVAVAIAGGASNKEAAAALFLSAKTVEFHLSSIYRKLGITSRSQLARHVALAS
jgi:DNA-binding CsgD family transcriptional regulator